MKKIKEQFGKLKLNEKFTLLILLLVIVPMFLFSIIIFKNIEDNSIQQLLSKTQGHVAENYGTVQKTVEMCNMSTQTFLNNQELKDFLIRLKNNEEITTEEYLAFDREDIAMLERMVNSNPYLYQICVYAYNNHFPEMMPILYHKSRMKNLPWEKDYVSGTWQFDYADGIKMNSAMNASRHLMALVSSVEDAGGEGIGVVEVAVPMDEIFPLIFQADNENWACFLQDDGTLHTGGKDEEECRWEPLSGEILRAAESGGEARVFHTKLHGENVILAVQPIRELSGTYIQLTSIQSSIDNIRDQMIVMIFVLLLITVFLFFVINAMVRALLKKFYETMKVIRQVQKNDMNVRVQNLGTDEMGELGIQINKMLDRIQLLMEENINREVLVKNTEIKALQNQINAHFIYNVLESVKMMAEIDEEYEISDAVTALGELLRYSMKWGSGNVTIRQEVEYIRNYIRLMNLRYDFVITLSMKIPDHIYEQEIPKMSLQPIVENAIIHGIEELDEDAVISIKVLEREDDFDIEITDSGKGMNEEQLELLHKKLLGEVEVSGGSGNGIGLKNVQDRIHMQFGAEYGLQFAAMEGCYTKVIIRLPFTNRAKEGNRDENAVDSGR